MKRLPLWITLKLWLMTLALPVLAQPGAQPLYAYMLGNLWRYDMAGGGKQLTNWGYDGGPILSPDGATLAFLSTSAAFVQQWEAGSASQSGGTPPADIWIMDLASETFTRIADQTDASPAGILRSLPAWSPDGARLAWIELDPQRHALDAASLRIYDLATGALTALATPIDLGSQSSDIHMPSLSWGGGGIARLLALSPGPGQQPRLFAQLIQANSGEIAQFDLGFAANQANAPRDLIWVTHLGESRLALRIQDYWELIEPGSGARSRLLDPPRMKNRGISGAMQVIPASVSNASGGWDIHWYASNGLNLFHSGYESPGVGANDLPAISPDGTRIAWHNGDHISSWNISLAEGNRALASDASHRRAFPIPEPVSVVWAPSEWITTGAVVGAVTQPFALACALTPLLSAGQTAIVPADTTLKVRGDATTSGSELGRIEGGALVTIVAGPVCADGYNWYALHDDSLAGWSAEGAAGDYWLLYHADCLRSPLTRLTTGMTATAAGDSVVNIRSGPGTGDTSIVWAVAAGDNFTITGLPQCGADGLRWYPARVNEIDGYIAEGQGADYWIEPVSG